MLDSKVVEAFQLMWGNFPDPALLINKSREIIAVNTACRTTGRVEGTKCLTYGVPESHKNCLANKALATQRAKFKKTKRGERDIITYWLPLDGYPDIYVHLIIGAMVDYNAIPEKP